MIGIETINAFLEVAKTGNMSLASQNLYLSQSAVSQRISSLEAHMGQTLFNRKYGGMELNRHGSELVGACKNLKKDIEFLNDWMDAQKNTVKGHIKILTVSSFIDYVFPAFLKKYFEKYRDVKFTINVHTSKHIEKSVLCGDHDLGIIVGECKKRSLESTRLMDNRVYMVCSKDHPLAKKSSITDRDLRDTKIIWHSEKGSRTVSQVAKKLGYRSIDEKGDIYLSDMESCKIYAMAGLGIAFISNNHMKKELGDGKLVKLGNFVLDKPAHLISRKEHYQNAVIRTFKEAFIKHCRAL